MSRFAANLTMMFTEYPFIQRFEKAAKAGFEAVEFLFPYEYKPEVIAAELTKYNLVQALFNMPPGNWDGGERGMAAIPGREQEFRDNVDIALKYALALKCKKLHAMSGIITGLDRQACKKTFVENFRYAAQKLAEHDIMLLVEPINNRDMPDYFIAYQKEAMALVDEVGMPNMAVQLDLYHAQIMSGDLTKLIEYMSKKIGHVQIASVPARHEPDEGELNYSHLYSVLDAVGYKGWIGCEYNPRAQTEDGLSWFASYRKRI